MSIDNFYIYIAWSELCVTLIAFAIEKNTLNQNCGLQVEFKFERHDVLKHNLDYPEVVQGYEDSCKCNGCSFFFFFFWLPASGMGLFLLCLISFFGYALSGASKVGVQLEGYSTERRIKQVNLQEPKIWCFLECT